MKAKSHYKSVGQPMLPMFAEMEAKSFWWLDRLSAVLRIGPSAGIRSLDGWLRAFGPLSGGERKVAS